jgi:hypothetical protein
MLDAAQMIKQEDAEIGTRIHDLITLWMKEEDPSVEGKIVDKSYETEE